MKAAWFDQFGAAAEVLKTGEFEDPEVQEGQVLVALETSGINPSDVKKRAGAFPNLLDEGPVIPNSDGAGVITAVGERVHPGRVGERVWVYQAQYGRRFGTAATLIAIDANRAVALPDDTSFEVGACIGIPIMTAHRCVFADGNVDGKRILVTGGAGRVGHYAIQWAVRAGAEVVATASNEEDALACEAAGAESIVNHREEGWHDAALDASNGTLFDRVIDVEFGANLPQTLQLIKTSGIIATYSSTVEPQPRLPFLQMMFQDLTVRMVIVYAMPEAAKRLAIADTTAALQQDVLQHRVAHVLPLADIARGNELIEQGGFRGCVVLECQ